MYFSEISSNFTRNKEEMERYAAKIKLFSDKSFDVVIVDGHARMECLKNCLPKIKPGGILILDNSDLPEFKKFHFLMKNFKSKTFNNGIWETTIFFAPKEGFSATFIKDEKS